MPLPPAPLPVVAAPGLSVAQYFTGRWTWVLALEVPGLVAQSPARHFSLVQVGRNRPGREVFGSLGVQRMLSLDPGQIFSARVERCRYLDSARHAKRLGPDIRSNLPGPSGWKAHGHEFLTQAFHSAPGTQCGWPRCGGNSDPG